MEGISFALQLFTIFLFGNIQYFSKSSSFNKPAHESNIWTTSTPAFFGF